LQSPAIQRVPTPQTPMTTANFLGRLSITFELQRLPQLPVEQVTVHPSAVTFPGAVPATATRVTQSVTIRAARPRWQSTGLYAAPGEIVTVRLPAAGLGRNFTLRIGA